jgi:paraquat-inducible protein B
MPSNIISETIDGTYPVAGVDNDTQGFRDNFTIIKTGLATAQSEITLLQGNTAKLNETNDFNGTEITDANFSLNTEKYHNIGTVVSGQNISFLNGHYQSMSVNLGEEVDTINFALADWPDRDHVAKMTVQMLGNDTAKTVTFTVAGGGTIKKNATFPTTLTIDSSTNPLIIDFWTYNQGTTVYAEYRGQFT